MVGLREKGDFMKANVVGLKDIEKLLKNFNQLPQKCVNKAAKQGAKIAFNAAKRLAPVDTGDLKRHMILKAEKTKIKGKKVFAIAFKDGFFDQVKTERKKPKKLKLVKSILSFMNQTTEKKTYSFYPALQEYGYFLENGRFIPGYGFMRKSIDNNKEAIEQKIIDVLYDEIEKLG
jgi:HK97 gp10 family phage protein